MTGRLGFCLALLGGVLWAAEPDREPGILWRAPASLGQDHWICGPGGCQSRPAPPFQFVRDETEGSSPKVQVRDANGRTWSVKFGGEAIPECFASRFVSALGYTAEKSYCINGGKIENLGAVRKPVEHSFREGRHLYQRPFRNARRSSDVLSVRSHLGLECEPVHGHARTGRTQNRDDAAFQLGCEGRSRYR